MHKAFHRFLLAKFAYDGSILGSSQFILLPIYLLDAQFQSGQNQLENNHLASLI